MLCTPSYALPSGERQGTRTVAGRQSGGKVIADNWKLDQAYNAHTSVGIARKEEKMALVLITGTSKGIGFETALAFARAGHNVLATMRNPSRSPRLAEVAAREKLPITISTMDVDSDESVREGFRAIHREHGPIDVLV